MTGVRRGVCILLVVCLVCLLGGCRTEVDSASPAASPSAAPTSAPDNHPPVIDDWPLFSLGEIGSRREPYPCYKLKADDNYGFLYPFAVPLSATEKFDWEGAPPPIESMPRNLFGLVDAQGSVVVDPVYSGVQMLTVYDELTGEPRPAGVYLLTMASQEGTWNSNRNVLAACDGRWVSEERYAAAFAFPDGIAVQQIKKGQSEHDWQWLHGLV